jgi:hypothetical protein
MTNDIEMVQQSLQDHTYFSGGNLLMSPIKSAETLNAASSTVSSPFITPIKEWPYDDDPDYNPNSDEDLDSSESEDDISDQFIDPSSEPKYIIFHSNLMDLFKFCYHNGCGKPLEEAATVRTVGSAVQVTTNCLDGHTYVWQSQPLASFNLYCGNLLLPAAVIMTGNSLHSFLEICKTCNITMLCERECYNIQESYVRPQVTQAWTLHNEAVLSVLQDEPVVLAGDCRCDSPGHSATLGTYTLYCPKLKLIVAQETVHVSEVKNSYWLEPEGLKRCLDYVTAHGITVSVLATDRHPAIVKIMRHDYSDIKHEFDLWHIVKGVRKKLQKTKKGDNLLTWSKAICNHLWYSSCTCNKDPVLLKEKWTSILCHITNQHSWATSLMHHACDHAKYSDEEEMCRPWLKGDSQEYTDLAKIVTNKQLLQNLEQVTEGIHTGELESIHSLYTKYATKRIKFTRESMIMRLMLAALDNNHNAQRQQASTKSGVPCFKLQYSKVSATYVVKPIRRVKEHGYRNEMLRGILYAASSGLSMRERKEPKTLIPIIPDHLNIDRPSKSDAIKRSLSRFNH